MHQKVARLKDFHEESAALEAYATGFLNVERERSQSST